MCITLTVFFEEPFWVGVFERRADGQLTAAKVTFGGQLSDQQVLTWIEEHFYSLRFSPGVAAAPESGAAANPKRRQRQAAAAIQSGAGTKAQQALKLAREAGKVQRRQRTKAQREAEAQRKLLLHAAKKKAKHRGR